MINSPVSKIKRRCTHIRAAVVDGEKEPGGQAGQTRFRAQSGVQRGYQRSNVGHTAADTCQWRTDDVANPLVGLRWQESGVPYRIDEAGGHSSWQAAKLQVGT